jgi:uncharacterized protein (DUF1810 family)
MEPIGPSIVRPAGHHNASCRGCKLSTLMSDPFDLQRFVAAQDPLYGTVLAELRAGCKRTHWMWFVFPQHAALGRSAMAARYGLASNAEAAAYGQHRVLGARLDECCRLVLALEQRAAHQIFASPDDLKLRSSMTLFAAALPQQPVFQRVLDRYYAGEPDARTLALL